MESSLLAHKHIPRIPFSLGRNNPLCYLRNSSTSLYSFFAYKLHCSNGWSSQICISISASDKITEKESQANHAPLALSKTIESHSTKHPSYLAEVSFTFNIIPLSRIALQRIYSVLYYFVLYHFEAYCGLPPTLRACEFFGLL